MDADKRARNGSLIKEYDSLRPTYEQFGKTAADLIRRLLSANRVSVHTISYRIKDRKSLQKKIVTKSKYNQLSDITDVVGVRVITNYSGDVDDVARVIEREFKVDKENTIDKRNIEEPSRFGYLSLHYVISLKESRSKLQEYAAFEGLKLEVQVRSLLQHTWAEIEHDIGYKSSVEVPKPVKRQFARLAGLLELADKEFEGIRKDIATYAREVDKKIRRSAPNIEIDAVSYTKYVTTNEFSLSVDRDVCEKIGCVLIDGSSYSSNIPALSSVSIVNIRQLNDLLYKLKDDVVRMGLMMLSVPDLSDFEEDNVSTVDSRAKGVASFYLCHVLAAKQGADFAVEYAKLHGWDEDIGGAEFVDLLVNFYSG